jgi:hypothetical protein
MRFILGLILSSLLVFTAYAEVKNNQEAYWIIYRQDSTLTPGAIETSDLRLICQTGYSGTVRKQTTKIKKEVFKRYGINWRDHSMYEDDHLIPLSLGGSNDITNRFPQFYCPKVDDKGKKVSGVTCFGAREKDVVENWSRHYVCNKEISSDEAKRRLDFIREKMVKDWFQFYRTLKGF